MRVKYQRGEWCRNAAPSAVEPTERRRAFDKAACRHGLQQRSFRMTAACVVPSRSAVRVVEHSAVGDSRKALHGGGIVSRVLILHSIIIITL